MGGVHLRKGILSERACGFPLLGHGLRRNGGLVRGLVEESVMEKEEPEGMETVCVLW